MQLEALMKIKCSWNKDVQMKWFFNKFGSTKITEEDSGLFLVTPNRSFSV